MQRLFDLNVRAGVGGGCFVEFADFAGLALRFPIWLL